MVIGERSRVHLGAPGEEESKSLRGLALGGAVNRPRAQP